MSTIGWPVALIAYLAGISGLPWLAGVTAEYYFCCILLLTLYVAAWVMLSLGPLSTNLAEGTADRYHVFDT